MSPNESHLRSALAKAGDKGLSRAAVLRETKIPESKFGEFINEYRSNGLIYGPFRSRNTQYYFDRASAPSREKTETCIEEILLQSGAKLVSRAALEKKMKSLFRPFFADALSALKGEGKIIEFKYGGSLLFVHRAPLLELMQVYEAEADITQTAPLTLADIRPAYEKLKAQQGGISVVKIFDLLKATGVAREKLHALLRTEARRGSVTLHPATTLNFAPEVFEAGVKLEGERDPRITVVFKEGR